MRERFQDYVEEAARLRTDALGESGSVSGHCIEFRELMPSKGKSEFCTTEDEEWHVYVPAETLELFVNDRNSKIGTMSADLG